jgi:hypothetical protein
MGLAKKTAPVGPLTVEQSETGDDCASGVGGMTCK